MFTNKSDQVTDMMRKIIGSERIPGECVTCKTPDLEFTDLLSRKEYYISGMCQSCQDKLEAMYGDD